LKEIVNVSSRPGPRMKRRSTRVLELRDQEYFSGQAVEIAIHTRWKMFKFQADEYAAELLNIFNTAVSLNEERWGLENRFEEKWNNGRKLISGFLCKQGKTHKAWRLRFCTLDESNNYTPCIKYYKNLGAKKPKGIIKLEEAIYVGPCLNADVIVSYPYAFEIFEKKRVWRLACNNRHQFKAWVEGIFGVIKRHRIEHCNSGSFAPAEVFKLGYLNRRTSSSPLNSKKLGTYSWKEQYIVLSGSELWFCNGMSRYHQLHRLYLLQLDGGTPKFGVGEGFLQTEGIEDVRRLVGNFYGRDGVIAIKGQERAVFLHTSDEDMLDEWISAISNAAGCEEAVVPASPKIFTT